MRTLAAVLLLTTAAHAERPDFSANQCRVLLQVRADNGSCSRPSHRNTGYGARGDRGDTSDTGTADSVADSVGSAGVGDGSIGGVSPSHGQGGSSDTGDVGPDDGSPGDGGDPGDPGRPGSGSGRPGGRPPIDIQKLKGRLEGLDGKRLKEFLREHPAIVFDLLNDPGKPGGGGFDPPKGGRNAR